MACNARAVVGVRVFVVFVFVVFVGASVVATARPARAQAAPDAGAPVTRSFRTSNDVEITYLLVRPPTLAPDTAYPVLVALPPGNQKRPMAEWMLRTYWTAEARRRGWIVVTPIRYDDDLLFEYARGHFAELVGHLRKTFQVEGAKVHLAGVSNGGMSAFRAAIAHPDLVHSLMTLPGFPPSESDFGRLGKLEAIPVAMYVGADDKDWVPQMERTRDDLARAGGKVTLTISPSEGHVLRSLGGGATLFDVLDRTR